MNCSPRSKAIKVAGSISLLFAMLIPALCLVLLAGLAYAERCAAEYDGVRCLKSAGELALASYSRSLWQSYGLWGVNPEEVNLSECEALLADLPDLVAKQLTIDYDGPLYEDGQLQDQINRYMRLRAPIVMGSDLLTRVQMASRARQDLSQGTALATIRQGHKLTKAYQAYEEVKGKSAEIKAYLPDNTGSDSVPEDGEDPAPANSDQLSEADLREGLETIAPLLRHFSHFMLPVYEAMGTGEVGEANSFDPSLIENLAAKLDRLLDQGLGATTEAMNLAEYGQLFFPAAVNYERLPGAISYLYTPQGESLQELAQTRPLELEQIASGLDKPKLAEKYCDAMITGMRFIPQYIAGQRNPTRQLRYQDWAEFLSSALAILSLGQVEVAPQVMKYFVQAADSLRLARKDYKELKSGSGLPFWPVEAMATYQSAQYQVKFYYRDYLRLLMYASSAEKLAKGLTRLIKQQEAGPYYTKLRVGLEINQRHMTYSYAYLDD